MAVMQTGGERKVLILGVEKVGATRVVEVVSF